MTINGSVKWRKYRNWVLWILSAVLIISIVYIIIKIITTQWQQAGNGKSTYILMLLKCILGIVVMVIPSFLEKKKTIDIPDTVEILYFVFLFLSIYLGEVWKYYQLVPEWDTLLHGFSGCMLSALGFTLINLLNRTKDLQFSLSPIFSAVFSFCFSLSAGTIWEIYEFLADGVMNLNMQGYSLGNGMLLHGQEALMDTMKDIIVDAVSALLISLIGYYSLKKAQRKERLKSSDMKN